jgi:RNA polymerase sigma-B factor
VYLGPRDEETLLELYRLHQDLGARDELVERYLPLVRRLARRYSYTTEPIEDLCQVGAMALLGAVERYRPGRGSSFQAYAVPTIVGEMRRHFRDTGWALHIPRSLQERAREVGATVGDLQTRFGRSPTIAEIGKSLDMSGEDVIEALEVRRAYDAKSLDAPGSAGDDADWFARLGDEDQRLEMAEYHAMFERTVRAMPERERVLLYLRFFEDLSQSEIAQRVGFSQMHVSRLLRKAISRLRAVADADADSVEATAAG